MSNKTGFEIMADNDCIFLSSTGNLSSELGLNYVIPCAYVVSAFVGFLILSKQENQKYPFKIVGLICLVQSSSIYALGLIDYSNCDTLSQKLLKNSLLTPSSWLA